MKEVEDEADVRPSGALREGYLAWLKGRDVPRCGATNGELTCTRDQGHPSKFHYDLLAHSAFR